MADAGYLETGKLKALACAAQRFIAGLESQLRAL